MRNKVIERNRRVSLVTSDNQKSFIKSNIFRSHSLLKDRKCGAFISEYVYLTFTEVVSPVYKNISKVLRCKKIKNIYPN